MAQTMQDFIHIGCEKGEECRDKSVYSRWFKRHFQCEYYNDSEAKYPLEGKCAAILELTEPQVRELITSTLPKINAVYQSYQLAFETSRGCVPTNQVIPTIQLMLMLCRLNIFIISEILRFYSI